MRAYTPSLFQLDTKKGAPHLQSHRKTITMALVVSARAIYLCTHLWERFFYRYDLHLAIRLHGCIIPPAKTMNMSTKVKDV